MLIASANAIIVDSINAYRDELVVDVDIDGVKLTGRITSTSIRGITIDVRGIAITTSATNIVRFH
jgi:hypothetical protein